jgi:hypothetical protein
MMSIPLRPNDRKAQSVLVTPCAEGRITDFFDFLCMFQLSLIKPERVPLSLKERNPLK